MILLSHNHQGELSDWFRVRKQKGPGTRFSILINSPCLVCQPRTAESLARYLNEFDESSDGGTWLFVDDKRREQIREDRQILTDHAMDPQDLDSFLISLGKIVFETSGDLPPVTDCDKVVRVHLSCKEPQENSCDLWLNAKQIDPATLSQMIASSYMEWTVRNRHQRSSH